MGDNIKYVAKIPIIPDDFENKNAHRDHELVMDFGNDDIYLKNGDGYVNITGKIKEEIKEIKDGSAVIHVVTEDTLPPIKDRDANHWYYVITKAEEHGGGHISTSSYVYYGLINTYSEDKNYVLISQNVTDGDGVISFEVADGYIPCLYIPINYTATFKNVITGENIDFEVIDRIYALNAAIGTYVCYDVYLLSIFTPGSYKVLMDLTGSNYFTINFEPNIDSIPGLILPEEMKIRDGDVIGTIQYPSWDDARYIFKGWSNDKMAETTIDPSRYKPTENKILFAWFEYNDDPSLFEFYAEYESSGS